MLGITKTKIIEGTYVGLGIVDKRDVQYYPDTDQSIVSFTNQTRHFFETEEGKKSFPIQDLSKSYLKKGQKVKIEQKHLRLLGIKISEKVII